MTIKVRRGTVVVRQSKKVTQGSQACGVCTERSDGKDPDGST